jgi:hypothetical protein
LYLATLSIKTPQKGAFQKALQHVHPQNKVLWSSAAPYLPLSQHRRKSKNDPILPLKQHTPMGKNHE